MKVTQSDVRQRKVCVCVCVGWAAGSTQACGRSVEKRSSSILTSHQSCQDAQTRDLTSTLHSFILPTHTRTAHSAGSQPLSNNPWQRHTKPAVRNNLVKQAQIFSRYQIKGTLNMNNSMDTFLPLSNYKCEGVWLPGVEMTWTMPENRYLIPQSH